MFKISLRAARVNADMTLNDAHKAIGVSEKTLANWEKGVSSPTYAQFRQMCELYNNVPEVLVSLPKKYSLTEQP